ncbi:MAG: class I SAM-dependent methyltransferase [Desulfarculaceae bacterium]
MNPMDLWNRPMLEQDLAALAGDSHALALGAMVREYAGMGLPVMNGSFEYSNLREGPSQVFTLSPYRLWEYASVFKALDLLGPEAAFLDIGGAASALPYYLAEQKMPGLSLELQPLLVDVCNHVARQRQLPLQAVAGDITSLDAGDDTSFALVCFVSVLEHIPSKEYGLLFRQIHKLLEPGGILYITFDYGTYVSIITDKASEQGPYALDQSIGDIAPVCESLRESGFSFINDDPLELTPDLAAQQSAPGHTEVARQYRLAMGPVDGRTSWRRLLRYALERLIPLASRAESRFAKHNFFRMFLQKQP